MKRRDSILSWTPSKFTTLVEQQHHCTVVRRILTVQLAFALLNEIEKLIKKNSFCVLTTVSSDGKPHAVGDIYSTQGLDIYNLTGRKTRKARNIYQSKSSGDYPSPIHLPLHTSARDTVPRKSRNPPRIRPVSKRGLQVEDAQGCGRMPHPYSTQEKDMDSWNRYVRHREGKTCQNFESNSRGKIAPSLRFNCQRTFR